MAASRTMVQYDEQPAILPMMKSVTPMFAGTLTVPRDVRSIRIAIYDARDAVQVRAESGRVVEETDEVVVVVDCNRESGGERLTGSFRRWFGASAGS